MEEEPWRRFPAAHLIGTKDTPLEIVQEPRGVQTQLDLFSWTTGGDTIRQLQILQHGLYLMPTKKSRGQELTPEEKLANQALHQRRLRIAHVNSRVKRCRIVKDRLRLWKQGVRNLVMELCCALRSFRVRLTPWQPMI
jgi:hypothetical protein